MNTISIGDKVTFTMTSQRGQTVSMTSKTGIVEAIDGRLVATVRTSKRTTYRIATSALRKVGEKTHLTEFAEEIFKANRAA
jgi:hypothetical protein